jgi:hypothetical protein
MADEMAGKVCRLTHPIRDHEGNIRFTEKPTIMRKVQNIDRYMYLVKFPDGATTWVFPDEVVIE